MTIVSDTQIQKIVALAARAPSGDNVQPWHFEWNGEILSIDFRPHLIRHVLDVGRSAPAIALGCLLEALEIAAGSESFGIKVDLKGFHLDDSPWAQVCFSAGQRSPESWIGALSRRTTDRRPFRGGRLPAEALQDVAGNFDRRHLATMYMQHSAPTDLLDYLVAAESLVAVHARIFPDTLPWIRMSRREAEQTKDGMPWQGAGVGTLEYPALRLMRAIPQSFPLIARAGMRKVYARRMEQLIRSSAGIVCFATPAPGLEAPVQVGRLAMRIWLRLTELGYGVQPLTISSLSVYNAVIGALDPQSRMLLQQRAPGGAEVLRRSFAIPQTETPVWILRTGVMTPLPDSWITQRKDLSSLLTFT